MSSSPFVFSTSGETRVVSPESRRETHATCHRLHRPNVSTGLNFSSKPPESPRTTTTKETSNNYVEGRGNPSSSTHTFVLVLLRASIDLNRDLIYEPNHQTQGINFYSFWSEIKTTTPVPADITKMKSESSESTNQPYRVVGTTICRTKARTSENLHRN